MALRRMGGPNIRCSQFLAPLSSKIPNYWVGPPKTCLVNLASRALDRSIFYLFEIF